MKTIHFIFILILFQSVLMHAQEPMVAYRKEGIWYYFDTNGKLMWQPYLDVASMPNGWQNGLLKASALEVKADKNMTPGFSRKNVLYDKKGKIVFQPKFEGLYRIVTGFDKAGYLQMRDLDADQLILCDKQGNVVYKSPHGYCQYLGDGVAAYIKSGEDTEGDKPQILFDIKTKKILNEISCVAFCGNYENGAVFSFNSKGHYGMYDRTGKELLKQIWDGDLLGNDEEKVLQSGFVCLQDTLTKKFILFNKKGEPVLKDIEEIVTLNSQYVSCELTIDGEMTEQTFFFINGKPQKVDAQKYGKIIGITEGGIIVSLKDDGDVALIDKSFKIIAMIKNGGDFENIHVLNTHIWVQTSDKNNYDCYNEKGQKTGSIVAELIDKAAYNHIPFMINNEWGLAHENGKVVIKPAFEFSDSEIPPVQNGFWEINNKLPDGTHRFDYYNFQGKLALSTTAEKDGWDFILSQETVSYFYKIY